MTVRTLVFLFIIAALISSSGCSGTCENACKKIIEECEAGIPSYNVTQCTAECDAIQTEYEAHDYLETNLELFQEQLDCIHDASCEDLLSSDAPACYQESSALYVF